jgi:hypothetical protein
MLKHVIRRTEQNYENVSEECQSLDCDVSVYSFSPVFHW